MKTFITAETFNIFLHFFKSIVGNLFKWLVVYTSSGIRFTDSFIRLLVRRQKSEFLTSCRNNKPLVKTFVELPENLQPMSIFPKKYDSFFMEKSFLKNDRRIIKYLIIKYVLFLSNYNLIISIWIRIFIEIIDFRFIFGMIFFVILLFAYLLYILFDCCSRLRGSWSNEKSLYWICE